MKEIKDIIKAYQTASASGTKTALATVVHVEGSSYRRPGARMLVTADGLLTGAISGGCLEGDALRKALLAINENKNKLVTYDTMDEDDAKFGVQLGCNGIVRILFEPINEHEAPNPIDLLKSLDGKRKDAVLVTLFSWNERELQPGTSLLYTDDNDENLQKRLPGHLSSVKSAIEKEIQTPFQIQTSIIKYFDEENITAFIELIHPSVSLVICGAGNDAIPVVAMAKLIGWNVTVIDGRAGHVTKQRFAEADQLIVTNAEAALNQVSLDEHTFFVLMTHNYNYDIEVFRQLSKTGCRYIGILGPKKKLNRMIDELFIAGHTISDEQLKYVYSPVGLDIGAETAEEIALSIIAEIKAVLTGRNPILLRDKNESIHSRNKI